MIVETIKNTKTTVPSLFFTYINLVETVKNNEKKEKKTALFWELFYTNQNLIETNKHIKKKTTVNCFILFQTSRFVRAPELKRTIFFEFQKLIKIITHNIENSETSIKRTKHDLK